MNKDNKDKKVVYVSLIADLLHTGHIRVLEEAKKHGEVTLGLLTSEAINELNDFAYLKYQQRFDVVNSLSMVGEVIPQNTASYHENLLKVKPDIVVHGDDWIKNSNSKYRDEVIELLSTWGGKLIEIQYSSETVSYTHLTLPTIYSV